MKKNIAIDLDGVLNNYNGEYKVDEIPLARNGAEDFLKELFKDFNIEIFTVRNKDLVQKWLNENNLAQYIADITNKKNPKTMLFIDDRALNFNGDFAETINQIRQFSPHWKK